MQHRLPLLKLLALAGVVIAFTGCGEPSEDTRQNRRLADSLLTAVTTKNIKELNRCKEFLDKRRADALLSESNHKKLIEISEMAKSGNWPAAEEALYKFREADPFPK